MRSAGSSSKPSGTAAARTTRSTGSAGCCAAAPSTTPKRSWAWLLAGIDAGDTVDEQLAKTWIAAQELRMFYRAPDRARAKLTSTAG